MLHFPAIGEDFHLVEINPISQLITILITAIPGIFCFIMPDFYGTNFIHGNFPDNCSIHSHDLDNDVIWDIASC